MWKSWRKNKYLLYKAGPSYLGSQHSKNHAACCGPVGFPAPGSCPVVGSWQWGCAQHWAARQDQLRLLLYSSSRSSTQCLQRSYLARDIRRVKNERSPPGQLAGRRSWKHVAG